MIMHLSAFPASALVRLNGVASHALKCGATSGTKENGSGEMMGNHSEEAEENVIGSREMKKKIWMEVTRDKYELPIRIADSAKELAEAAGTTLNNVRSAASHYKHGRHPVSRFHAIEAEEDE